MHKIQYLILIIFLLIGNALGKTCDNNLAQNAVTKYLEDNPLTTVTNKKTGLPEKITIQRASGKITILNPSMQEIGFLEYTYAKDNTNLKSINVAVNDEYRGQGLNKYLLALTLDSHPNTETIGPIYLTTTNAEAAFNVLQNQGDELSAIKATPAYKIRASLGFSKVIHYEFYDSKYSGASFLTVGKD